MLHAARMHPAERLGGRCALAVPVPRDAWFPRSRIRDVFAQVLHLALDFLLHFGDADRLVDEVRQVPLLAKSDDLDLEILDERGELCAYLRLVWAGADRGELG